MSKETTTETEAPVQVENIGTMEDEPTFESKIVTEYGDVVAQEALGDNIPPGYYTSPNFLGTIFAGGLGALSGYFGWVLASNSLANINADLGPDANYLWAPLAYTITQAIGDVLLGRLSDIFGRRYFLIGGNFVALIGAIIAATAQNIPALIASNAFIGLGGACQFSYFFVLPELVPRKARGLVIGFCYLIAIPGSAFGSVIARSFIANTSSGWRWDYYLAIITTCITILLLFFFYHPPTFEMLHVGKTRWQKIKSLDYGGIFLFVTGLILFIMGINWGGQLYPWKSTHVIGCIVIGFLTMAAFVVYEAFIPEDPLIPLKLMRNLECMMFVVVACIGGMIYYSMTVLWPTIISTLYTPSEVYDGWLSMSVGGSNAFGTIVCSYTFAALGRVRYQLIAALVLMTAFVGAMSSTTQYSKNRSISFAVIGTFFGGWTEGLCNASVSFTVNPEDIGLAVGVLSGMRVMVGGIATAIYNSILANKSQEYNDKYIPRAVTAAGLPLSSLDSLFASIAAGTDVGNVPGMNGAIEVALAMAQKDALSEAVKIVFLVSIAFGGLALISTLFIKNIDHLLTSDVSRKLHNRNATTVTEEDLDNEKRVHQHV